MSLFERIKPVAMLQPNECKHAPVIWKNPFDMLHEKYF